MNLNESRNSGLLSWVLSVGSDISSFYEENEQSSRFLMAETYLRPSRALGRPVFGLARAVWAGGSVLGFPWTSLPNNNHNPVTTQFQGYCLDSNANHNHVVTT